MLTPHLLYLPQPGLPQLGLPQLGLQQPGLQQPGLPQLGLLPQSLYLPALQSPHPWAAPLLSVPQLLQQQPVHITPLSEGGSQREVNSRGERISEQLLREVRDEVVASAIPDLTREVLNEAITDVVFSYLSHQWATQVTARPRPLTQPCTTSSQLRWLPCQPPVQPLASGIHSNRQYHRERGSPSLWEAHHYDHLLHSCHTEAELSRELALLLLDQMAFQLMLTCHLDGGVSMTTRTQSRDLLKELVFNELLVKLISY